MTNIYVVLCRTQDPASQIDTVVAAIPSNLYATLLIKVIENITSACSWEGHGYSDADNCAFINAAVAQVQSYGLLAGVFSTVNIWGRFFGNSCNSLGAITPPINLWYARYNTSGRVDPVLTFADYSAFGGWGEASMKQVAGSIRINLCDIPGWTAFVDFNWFP
jgi:hypothetical protein